MSTATKKTSKKTSTKKTTSTTSKATTEAVETVKEEVAQPVKEEVVETVKEEVVEPVKEVVKEPVKVVAKEPVKEVVKEPVKEAVKEPAKPVVKEEVKKTVSEENKETSSSDGKKKGEFKEKFMAGVAKIPTGLTETENKLKLTSSKLFALTGSLFCIFEGRAIMINGAPAINVLPGIISILIGAFIFITLNIIDFEKLIKRKMPYEWFLLMGLGLLEIIVMRTVTGMINLKGGTLLMIGGLVLLMQSPIIPAKLKIQTTHLVSLIGIVIGIYEGIWLMASAGINTAQVLTGIVMILICVLFFLTLQIVKVKLPKELDFSWWLVLTIGMAMYYLAYQYQLSGIVVIHVFIMLLVTL